MATIDLAQASLPEVFQHLKCDENGLTTEEAARRLAQLKLSQPLAAQSPIITQFLGFLWNPISWTIQLSAVGLLVLSSGRHRPPDWPSVLGLVFLLCINCTLDVLAERRAFTAVHALSQSTAFDGMAVRIKRDGVWSENLEPSYLVPGDIVSLQSWDVVPANCRLMTGSLWISSSKNSQVRKEIGARLSQGWEVGVSSAQCEAVVVERPNRAMPPPRSRANNSTTGLHGSVAQIGAFCLALIAIFLFVELVALYGGFHYSYHRGINPIFVLLIGSLPIALPSAVSIILSMGVADLVRRGVLTTRVAAVAELAGVTVLCVDPDASLIKAKDEITGIKAYGPFSEDEVLSMSAYARSKKSPAPSSFRGEMSYGQGPLGHPDIDIVHCQPLSIVGGPMRVTYRTKGSTQLKRVAKGMVGHIAEICTRNFTNAVQDVFEADLEAFSDRGMGTLAVAYEELEGDDPLADGNGFEIAGLLAFSRPPLENIAKTVAELLRTGTEMKMVSRNQLAILKETGRLIGVGDKMFPARVFKEHNLDALILEASGFAGMSRKHSEELFRHLEYMGHVCAMIGKGSSKFPLSTAGVSITVSTDTVWGDLVVTPPCLPKVVDAIRSSRQIFQRLRVCLIYSCAVTIRSALCFSLLAFVYKIDISPFTILLVTLATNLATLSLCVDRVAPSSKPSRWDVKEILSYSTAYGVYMALSTILFVHAAKSDFFHRKLGLMLSSNPSLRNRQLNTLIYLQVAQVSHALPFVLRSQRFSSSSRPSTVVLAVFCAAQISSSIVAAYGNWGFAGMHAVGAGWIGLVWVWNIIWFIPLDFVKFGVRLVLN
ncbi:hypothetical protein C8R46DRAFT_1091902 [Mycena filopes]|nr:hypothetical protein C8R46DRAFT_1091902 [Mycena filopes]